MIPAADLPIFQTISAHETAHVALLESVLGANAVPKPTFDFTAGGTFDPFGNYDIFKALSQGFEDTGVRAYKGQAGADRQRRHPDHRTADPLGRGAARVGRAAAPGAEGLDHRKPDRCARAATVYAGEEAANGAASGAQAAKRSTSR